MKTKKLGKSPAFQFYPDAWLSSCDVNLMTIAEEGAYHRLLCWAWMDPACSLPDDDKQLAQLSRLGRFWNRSSDIIRRKFRSEGGRLFNDRLVRERSKQEAWRAKSSLAGKQSATNRATNVQPKSNQYDNQEVTLQSSSLSLNQKPNQNHVQPKPLDVSVDNPGFNTLEADEPPLKTRQREWFERWWLIYWRKEQRKAAFKAFCKYVTGEARFQQVMAATAKQKSGMMQKENQYRPLGASWINGERWEDEAVTVQAAQNGAGASDAELVAAQEARERRQREGWRLQK